MIVGASAGSRHVFLLLSISAVEPSICSVKPSLGTLIVAEGKNLKVLNKTVIGQTTFSLWSRFHIQTILGKICNPCTNSTWIDFSKSFVRHLSSFYVNVHWNCLNTFLGDHGVPEFYQRMTEFWHEMISWLTSRRRTWEFQKGPFIPCKHSTIHMGSDRLPHSAALIAGGSIVSSSPHCLSGFWLLSGLSWMDCAS